MQDRIDAFLHYMSAERGSSRNTIDAYRNDLTRFASFSGEQVGDGDIPAASSIDRDLITGYVAWLGDRGYAPATVARKVAAVKSFCGYLLDHGDLTENPTASIDSPRAPKATPKPLSTQEVDALLKQPLTSETPEAIRDSSMLELMYATGMRVTELVSLNLDSLHLTPRPGSVRCIGKGDRERTIPVYDKAMDALERYLAAAVHEQRLLRAALEQP
ncbi:MAG: site-specific integrase, partial [Chloroflexota bacterium]|nr:site-specific integrase [Chloroflexota bacterium]